MLEKTRRPVSRTPGGRPLADRLLAERLVQDQRGAIMVVGIFIAAMLVGILYYVWGVGGAVLFRERMQDASDTSAFSAAVIHARGMNILVLINVIMAAMAAVEAGIATAADGIMYAAIFATATCSGCGWRCVSCCRACPYVVPYWSSAAVAEGVDQVAGAVIGGLMDAAHAGAQAIEMGTPLAAHGLVQDFASSAPYSPVVREGIMFPLYEQLAAEDDPTNDPCDDRVFWPAAAVAQVAGRAMLQGGTSQWYWMGMGTAMVLDHPQHVRRFCPDYFQRVKEGAEMGEEDFQIRTLMRGRSTHTWTRRGVAIADWSRSDGTAGWIESFEPLTELGFAQAEYFYDGQVDRDEWLWHQRWRARLRRFRIPSGGGGLEQAMGIAGAAASQLQDAVDVVVH
jgi:hypothetical protein